jgi:hypothetical protein
MAGRWRPWWLLVLLACVIPTLPLLATEIPPLTDYPNHLARLVFLGTQTGDPVMSAMLAPDWQLLPNLGVDAVMPWVLRVLPVHVAGRAMLAVLLMLPVLGVVLLSRATFGRWSAWALGGSLVACNALFLMGFLNFVLATGLAMVAAAGWYRFREVRPGATVAGAVVAGVALFFCHLAGVAFFLMLVGAYEAERCWAARRAGFVRTVAWRGAGLVGAAVVPLVLYRATALGGLDANPSWSGPSPKWLYGLYPVLNYSLWLDIATAVLIGAVLVVGVASGRMVVPGRWRIMIAGLALLFLSTPFAMSGLAYVDSRFSILLAFAVFAGVRPVGVPRGVMVAVCAAGLGLLLGRTALVASVWHGYGAEVADVRAAIADVEPGARVLPVWVRAGGVSAGPQGRLLSDGNVMDWHLPAVIMLDRRAFWPYLFASPGQQPVRWLGASLDLAHDTPHPVHPDMLSVVAPSAAERAAFPAGETWASRYDYVLLMQSGGVPIDPAGLEPGRLEVVRSGGAAALLRVRRGGR